MRPNDADLARARLMLANEPTSGTIVFDRDLRQQADRVEPLADRIAIRRGATFTDDEVIAALRGDGQDEHTLWSFALDCLLVFYPHPEIAGELAPIWRVSDVWRGDASAALLAQVERLRGAL